MALVDQENHPSAMLPPLLAGRFDRLNDRVRALSLSKCPVTWSFVSKNESEPQINQIYLISLILRIEYSNWSFCQRTSPINSLKFYIFFTKTLQEFYNYFTIFIDSFYLTC